MRNDIKRIPYDPPTSHRLDIEVLTLSEFRTRVTPDHLRDPQRMEFHLIIFFTAGRCTHMVDFESYACTAGSVLVLRPGQVQRFDTRRLDWQGWMVLFRPELLYQGSSPASRDEQDVLQQLEELPAHQELPATLASAATEAIQRMALDVGWIADKTRLQPLLRFQLLALLTRLHLAQPTNAVRMSGAARELERFRRFRRRVEQEFRRWHHVSDYASQLGCSEKSLSRTTLAVVGITAKQYLVQRIALEAKRLLVHTGRPVANIADELGFDEATNFVKFFRREVGDSPARFRDAYGSGEAHRNAGHPTHASHKARSPRLRKDF